MSVKNIRISVITATYNSEDNLPALIKSLANQSDLEYEWVVADGGSTDRTLSLIEDARKKIPCIVLDSREDFGIYDALNRAIKLASGDYYLIAGSDDIFYPEALRGYRSACESANTEIVTASIHSGEVLIEPGARPWPQLYGPFARISGHAVGVAILRSLHDRIGYYSRFYPIAADQFFLSKALLAGARVETAPFVAGKYAHGGTSGQHLLAYFLEAFRVQVSIGRPFTLQLLILLIRIIKNFRLLK